MSRSEKLTRKLLGLPTTMRFTEVKIIIEAHGYQHQQPRGGSSHHIFRKPHADPLSIPVRKGQIKRIYLRIIIEQLALAEGEKNDE